MSTNRFTGIFIAITAAVWVIFFVLSPQPKYESVTPIAIPGLPISSTLSEELKDINPYELKNLNLNIRIEDTISSAKSIVEETDFGSYVYKIGAFGSSATVSKVVKSFNDAGFPSFTQRNKSNENLTNVLVGPFASKQDIKDNQNTLNQIAGIEAGEVLTWNP